MDKQIPLYFDSIVIDSPTPLISDTNSNLSRLKVRVFTKYGNRNGSYITDAVADQLIESATNGMTPVVGFYDPASQKWASHTGPELAKAYGYVEDFLGWEPFTDTDGITREYAVFSVILFVDYYKEANNILNQNQSMELNPETISGNWAVIDGNEYFVYTAAKMQGFCIIGENEPCFSVSSFYSLNGADSNNSQFEVLSSFLFELKTQVEEMKKINKGGETAMDSVENIQEQEQVVEEVQDNATFSEHTETVEPVVEEQPTVEEPVSDNSSDTEQVQFEAAPETEAEVEAVVETTFSAEEYNKLQDEYNQLKEDYDKKVNEFSALQTENTALKTEKSELETKIAAYENQMSAVEVEKKNTLIKKYEKVLKAEEINDIREKMNDFTYDELESKLAICFANSKINNVDNEKVLIPEQPESQFALLMKNYRKK